MNTSNQKSLSHLKNNYDEKKCLEAFQIFGDIPTLSIIHFLGDGAKRFTELEKLTEINPVTLTERLKKLVSQRIIMRTEGETDKQSVSYSLDTMGKKALLIIKKIEEFTSQAKNL